MFLAVKNSMPATARIIITEGRSIFQIVSKKIFIVFVKFKIPSLKIVVAVIVAIGKMQFGENIAMILNWIGMLLLMPYLITSIKVFHEEVNDEK